MTAITVTHLVSERQPLSETMRAESNISTAGTEAPSPEDA